MTGAGSFVCFGEILLRLNAAGHERLTQTRHLDIHVGGAEANVAIALAQLGADVRMVSVLPDNDFGHRAAGHLRSFGVDCSSIQFVPGRMGLYFAETGAVTRASSILYDRDHSAFADMAPDQFDWPALLEGAGMLHLSGITPATGAGPTGAAEEAVRTARAHDVEVSFDGNYRAGLWAKWGGDGPSVLRDILSRSTTAFINERDIALILGGAPMSRPEAMKHAFEAFPDLHTVACTARQMISARDMDLGAEAFTRDDHIITDALALRGVIERIGGGDAFAAGFLWARHKGQGLEAALQFALTASALKHSMTGDQLIASEADIDAALSEGGLDVKR